MVHVRCNQCLFMRLSYSSSTIVIDMNMAIAGIIVITEPWAHKVDEIN